MNESRLIPGGKSFPAYPGGVEVVCFGGEGRDRKGQKRPAHGACAEANSITTDPRKVTCGECAFGDLLVPLPKEAQDRLMRDGHFSGLQVLPEITTINVVAVAEEYIKAYPESASNI